MKNGIRVLPDIAGIYSLVMFVVLVFFSGGRALLDGDTLWHIKVGTEMLERRQILTSDIFSHTVYGRPWTAHEWLSEVIMGGVHGFAGLSGVVIFYFLLAVLTYWLLFRVARLYGAGDGLAVVSVSVAVLLSLTHLLARPHVFTWLFGVLFVYLLRRGGRGLLLMPLIMVLWVNLHGGFIIGLVLQGLFVLGAFLDSEDKNLLRFAKSPGMGLLLVSSALSLVAVGVNPFGYGQLLFPFYVSNEFFRKNVLEWQAPDLQSFWELRYFVVFVLLALSSGKRQVSWTNRLFLVFFVNAALTHVRHISIAGLFLTPFVIEVMRPWERSLLERFAKGNDQKELALSPLSGMVATSVLGVLLLVFFATGNPVSQKFSEVYFPLPDEYSRGGIEYIKSHHPEGNVFNYDSFGDYMIYTLGTSHRVFIDGRIDMYGQEVVTDYKAISGMQKGSDALFDKYDIGWVVVPESWPLVRHLKGQVGWEEAYRDDQLSILVRKYPSRS